LVERFSGGIADNAAAGCTEAGAIVNADSNGKRQRDRK
jgi:hypothetical protein